MDYENTKTAMNYQPPQPPPAKSRMPMWAWVILSGMVLLMMIVMIVAVAGVIRFKQQATTANATAAAYANKLTQQAKAAKTDVAQLENSLEILKTQSLSEKQTLQAEQEGTIGTLMVEITSLEMTVAAVPSQEVQPTPTLAASMDYPVTPFIYCSSDSQNLSVRTRSIGSGSYSELLNLPGTNLTGLAYSPDGSRITFYAKVDDQFDLFIMNANGANLVNLTQTSNVESDPRWSPDSAILLYAGLPGSTYEIYTLPVSGGSPTNLTNNAYDDIEPAWSPDGNWVIFSSDRNVDKYYSLYQMDKNGNNLTMLTAEDDNSARNPTYSPDGNSIVYNNWNIDWDILIYDLHSGAIHNLTGGSEVDDWSPVWSPDGTMIAYSSMSDGTNADIYVMNADGSNVRRLTTESSFDWLPAWTPDGQFITYESDITGNWQIYLVDPNGAATINLIEDTSRNSGEISWEP